MRRLVSVFVIFIFIISLGACTVSQENKNNQTTPPKQQNKQEVTKISDYFPLIAGSSWEYEGIGNEFASFNREVLFVSGKHAQIKEDNGGTVSTSIFTVSDDNIERVYFSGETYTPENLLPDKFSPNDNTIILKSPLKVGTSWGEGDNKREISSLDISTDTPVGKFPHCLQIKSGGQDSTVYEYYSKGTGLVKREFISGEAKIISQLKKYISAK
ncbi:MAG: hypothetical protein ABFD18_01840 [Syntrophomonas sp.]